ncbi:acid protease [Sodiomyces alkalinus F11]|uniref:Acid protease n=1 Tax=Sodiomyces alkalinus (strain CBS 110278 / VKM F-3762 / F11) TaxID=1314773 RepID=A0A3N2PUD2_SODAK|nr:acid protease [Sodiomyces alkalinus F11]ROT38064.1 acid protease [Sodiomyces alkalinus F11]
MAPPLLLVPLLVVCAQAWPQLPVDDIIDENLITLPLISPAAYDVSRAPVSDRREPSDHDDSGLFLALPVIHSPKRSIINRPIELELANRSDIAYYAQLNIGTPPQPVYAQLDTGSFELWVNPTCANLRPADERFCEAVGTYEPSNSSTSNPLGTSATLRYGIGSANITYLRDDITLGSSPTVRQVQFGTATSTTDKFAGILGLGHGQNHTTSYPTLLDELALQGAIRTKAFSLALGSKDAGQGQLILGGIDPAKFTGSLAPLPVIPAPDAPDRVARYWVSLRSIHLTPPSGISRPPYNGSAIPVFLDSGATMTLLPPELAGAIAADFGAPEPDANGFYSVDCGLVDLPGTIGFVFEGVAVPVSYREMIRVFPGHGAAPARCVLGIMPSEEFTLLGDTFLRSAYVVFDLEADVVHMAPYVDCGSRTMGIRGSEFIGGLVGLCSSGGEGEGEGEDGDGDEDEDDDGGVVAVATSTAVVGNGVAPTPVFADDVAADSGEGGDDPDRDPESGSEAHRPRARWVMLGIAISWILV